MVKMHARGRAFELHIAMPGDLQLPELVYCADRCAQVELLYYNDRHVLAELVLRRPP